MGHFDRTGGNVSLSDHGSERAYAIGGSKPLSCFFLYCYESDGIKESGVCVEDVRKKRKKEKGVDHDFLSRFRVRKWRLSQHFPKGSGLLCLGPYSKSSFISVAFFWLSVFHFGERARRFPFLCTIMAHFHGVLLCQRKMGDPEALVEISGN